jgi:hypothetical protein
MDQTEFTEFIDPTHSRWTGLKYLLQQLRFCLGVAARPGNRDRLLSGKQSSATPSSMEWRLQAIV